MATAHALDAAGTATLARVRRRLIPFLFLLYVVSYLDRINVGFAALQMNRALGLSATAYGLGAGIFFLSYTLFEVPSNLILARLGARVWIARIMITWGLVSAGMMLARGPMHFYVLRFLLGAAEAGFFPGVIYYLTVWFPRRERARTVAAFMTAVLAAGTVGGPVSGLLLSMHGIGGLAGWQWLFLLEGLPAVVLGVAVLWRLPDGPRDATWLSASEQAALVALLERDRAHLTGEAESVRAGLVDPRVWRLAVLYFTMPLVLYTVGFWLPQIIKPQSGGSDAVIGMLSAIPYLVGVVGMVVAGRHSDRTGERRWHIVLAAIVCGLALAAASAVHSVTGSIVMLSLAMFGVSAMFGPFWALATSSLGGVGAAAAIALINAIGNTSGLAGPYLVGYVHDVTGSFSWGLFVVSVVLLLVPLLALTVDREAPGTPAP
jgi:ACS family tartrate transporter-like MFS transporter